MTVTGAELYLSAASWSFEAELMDPRRRGEYQGAAELSGTLGRVWAPALFTFLAMSWGALGWVLIATIIVAATVGLHPAVRRAQAFLAVHGPPPEGTGRDDEAVTPPPSLLEQPALASATEGVGPPTAPR